jgi:hypothetical protein
LEKGTKLWASVHFEARCSEIFGGGIHYKGIV